MSRQIFLDTETTGLSAEGGDRIIEIGCVELLNRKLTGNNLHLRRWPRICWTICRAQNSSSTTPRLTSAS
jgi:DNA polymerase III epsilon subunit-like protein